MDSPRLSPHQVSSLPQLGGFSPGGGEDGEGRGRSAFSVTPGLQLVNIKTQELNATSLLGAMKALRLTAKSPVREQEVVTG